MTPNFQWKMRKIAPLVQAKRFSRVVRSCLAISGWTLDAISFGDYPGARHQPRWGEGGRKVGRKSVISKREMH